MRNICKKIIPLLLVMAMLLPNMTFAFVNKKPTQTTDSGEGGGFSSTPKPSASSSSTPKPSASSSSTPKPSTSSSSTPKPSASSSSTPKPSTSSSSTPKKSTGKLGGDVHGTYLGEDELQNSSEYQDFTGAYVGGENILGESQNDGQTSHYVDVTVEGSKEQRDVVTQEAGTTMTWQLENGEEGRGDLTYSAELTVQGRGTIEQVAQDYANATGKSYDDCLKELQNRDVVNGVSDWSYTVETEITVHEDGSVEMPIPDGIEGLVSVSEVDETDVDLYWQKFFEVSGNSSSTPSGPSSTTPKSTTPNSTTSNSTTPSSTTPSSTAPTTTTKPTSTTKTTSTTKPTRTPSTPTPKANKYFSIEQSVKNYQDLDPNASASITSEIYDVAVAIPTSEDLNYNLSTDESLYNIDVRTTTISATVENIGINLYAYYDYQYEQKYIDEEGNEQTRMMDAVGVTYEMLPTRFSQTVSRTYYDVPTSNIYPVQSGNLSAIQGTNALNSGNIQLRGGKTIGAQTLNFNPHNPDVSDVVLGYGGYYNSYAEARRALESGVGSTNAEATIMAALYDSLRYTGSVNYSYGGLHVTTTSNNGVTPTVGKVAGTTTNTIPSTYPNGTYQGSGSVTYAGGHTFGVTPNNVVIHTPVVNNATISSVSEFVNQKINQSSGIKYLILDGSFTITIPDEGTHNSYKGYGTRKYNSNQGVTKLNTTWGKMKDIKLPFDAYLQVNGNEKYFIPKNTWLSESGANVSLKNNSYTYTIPVWVEEQTYNIETRVIAENAVNESMYGLVGEGKNGSVDTYVATRKVPVEVIGKIYDLRVSSSNDPGWYNQIKNEYVTAENFPFGQAGQNKVTAYRYAPKLGYTFVFDFKTKGRKSNNMDISAYPEFYFVSKNGGNAEKVDLYYNTVNEHAVKISESDARVPLTVKYTDTFMKVPSQEIADSTRIYTTKYNYNVGVNVGTFAHMYLPHSLRLCYNNFAEYVGKLYGSNSTKSSIMQNALNTPYSNENMTGENIVVGSVGHWFAGYRLPASTVAVAEGTTVTPSNMDSVKKQDGYILVKMVIKSKFDSWDYLQYIGPEALNEGGEPTSTEPKEDWRKPYNPNDPSSSEDVTLPNGKPAKVPEGTIVIYDADLRSSNDYENSGTH